MRGWSAVLAVTLLAGCTAGEAGNPNLLAPKLVVAAPPGQGVTVFIHSAFGERSYDMLTLILDNVTKATRARAFSLEEVLPETGFFLEVRARAGEESYGVRGRVDLVADKEQVRVALVDAEGKWSEPREFNLPFERILERREAS